MAFETTTNAATPDNTTPAQALDAAIPAQAAPEAPAAEKPPEQDLSKQFAMLSKREAAQRAAQKALDERAKKYEKYESTLSKSKEDPMAVLEAAGLSVDDLIHHVIKKGQPPSPEDRVLTVEDKLKKLEAERESEREAARQESINREVDAFKSTIKASVDNDKAKYELIAANDAYEVVFETCRQLIQEAPDKYPTRKDVEAILPKVMDLVENELFEKAKSFVNVGKFKSLFQTTPTEAVPADSPQARDMTEPPTLTNKQAPTPQAAAPGKLLSREESLKRAASLLKFT
jgi:hypothetical protein